MLSELHIENFALIDKLTATFAPGLNVLSGETGAGKSIVIDAINVLLGERAGTDLVRTGSARALVQGTFDLSHAPHLLPALAELGAEPEDGLLYLAREVAREGKNIARINGRACPVSVIRQIGDLLVDLHGQHEHQSLLRQDQHIDFLDALGDAAFQALRDEVAEFARRRTRLRQEFHDLQTDERDRLRAIDLLMFQVDEIDNAQVVPGEDHELAAERSRLVNAEKLHAAATVAYELLYEGVEEGGAPVTDALSEACAQLAAIARFDPSIESVMSALDAALVQIAEVSRDLGAYRDSAQFDPERLAEVDERLATLTTLKRKYGETLEGILEYCAEKRAELNRLTHHEERRDELQAEIDRVERTLTTRALALSTARRALGDQLAGMAQAELTELGMPKAQFLLDIRRAPQQDGLLIDGERVAVTTKGIDQVAFHFSANQGEPPRPLAKIASGGELSRVMLALKSVAARGAGVPTLIFDEIDTGIGGRTAEVVGEKLAHVSRARQVICVTHLAQIAYYGDAHFLLEKTSDGERTRSTMRALATDERVDELARLQAGGRVNAALLDHIRAVLDEIQTRKALA